MSFRGTDTGLRTGPREYSFPEKSYVLNQQGLLITRAIRVTTLSHSLLYVPPQAFLLLGRQVCFLKHLMLETGIPLHVYGLPSLALERFASHASTLHPTPLFHVTNTAKNIKNSSQQPD